ncbi:MAG: glycosyltransferase [Anaerolineae bacterium]|nr:glycosyltransferase [Anaerolineae bacterium]
MPRPALHQFIVGAAPGDAITDQALLLRRWLRQDGFRSEVFAESIAPEMAADVQTYLGYRPSRPGELVILHHSIGTALVDDLLSMDVRFLVIYHNITPAEFVLDTDPVLAGQLARGQAQLHRLRERTRLGLADSAYNEAELVKADFGPTGVLPITLDETQYNLPSNPALLARYQEGGPYLLFVGRLVPNKRQEDLIRLLKLYHRIEPAAHLFLVGAPWAPEYADGLRELAQEMGLGSDVTFTGRVPQSALLTYYRLADLYVSMSEHEGFGKPLAESMLLGLPVMAYAAAAVPGTLGGSGILFREKNYEALAELADILIKDGLLRQRIIARQQKRAQAFTEANVMQIWRAFLAEVDDLSIL